MFYLPIVRYVLLRACFLRVGGKISCWGGSKFRFPFFVFGDVSAYYRNRPCHTPMMLPNGINRSISTNVISKSTSTNEYRLAGDEVANNHIPWQDTPTDGRDGIKIGYPYCGEWINGRKRLDCRHNGVCHRSIVATKTVPSINYHYSNDVIDRLKYLLVSGEGVYFLSTTHISNPIEFYDRLHCWLAWRLLRWAWWSWNEIKRRRFSAIKGLSIKHQRRNHPKWKRS